MILMAIGVLFIAWGVFMLFRDTGTSEGAAQDAATSTSAPVATQASQGAQETTTAAGGDNSAVASSETTQEHATSSSANSDAGAQGGKVPVRVLNNSTVQGLAQRVADDVRESDFEVSEVGNFSETTFAQSVVYYTPGKGDEEKTARALADSLGISAAPRDAQAERMPAGVVLVITQDLQR